MPGRYLALACLLLLAAPLSGCWVIDEIDRGSKWLDDHSEKGAKEKAAAKAQADAPTPGQKGALDALLQGARREGHDQDLHAGPQSARESSRAS